jgi:putative Mn2+ efflux pump MntP
MFAIILAALAVSAGNLAAAASIGAVESSAALRTRVVLAFALFEGGMPVVGAVLERRLAEAVSSAAKPLAGSALALMGLYVLWSAIREESDAPHPLSTNRGILLTSALLSIDNLVVGDALGAAGVSLTATALTFGAVAILVAFVGLRIGAAMNSATARSGEFIAGALLLVIGVATAVGAF